MTQRPDVLVLDVNETLSDLGSLRDRFELVGLDGRLLDTWFAATLRDGFALTAAGAYPPFRDVAADALRTLLAAGGTTGAEATAGVETVLAGFTELPVHPDVGPGLRRIHESGIRLVTLTNGAVAISERMLDRAGLLPLLEARLSVDVPQRWKPRPEAYRYAADACGVDPASMALVAVHPWDVDGARRAGMSGIWINRRGMPYPTAFLPPDVEVPDFEALADRLAQPASAG
jgi:2-haloacid dehalogenase